MRKRPAGNQAAPYNDAMIRFFRLPAAHRRLYGIGSALLILAALIALIPAAVAQVRRPPPALQDGTRALLEGRYDEVPSLVSRLDQQDPAVAALKARALIPTGRYQDAETLLKPVAQRLPTSDAALELGLLLHMLTRPEAASILERVPDGTSSSRSAADLARAARALRALDQPQDANSLYREVIRLEPDNPRSWYGLALAYASIGNAAASEEARSVTANLDGELGSSLRDELAELERRR